VIFINRYTGQIIENFNHVILTQTGKKDSYTKLERYTALAALVKEYISQNWADTKVRYRNEKVKQVYYLSMEFLTGNFLKKNLEYLGMYKEVQEALATLEISIDELIEVEVDQGLGNGGLGRLAAAFLDSLSSLSMPGHGCGIRYKNGLFEQKIVDGEQVEFPDQWLKNGNVWEYKRVDEIVDVKFGGNIEVYGEGDRLGFHHTGYDVIKAVPYDMPIIGYLNKTVNTLRLWSAEEIENALDFHAFSMGKYSQAYEKKNQVESLTQVLYPNDEYEEGKILRLKQEYFLVSASLQSIMAQFRKLDVPISSFHEYIAVHINDTHPALAVPELMRLLMDENNLKWEEAWKITVNTLAYTNHTIMREAMETWNMGMLRKLMPRISMIVEEISARFLSELKDKGIDESKIENMSIISHDTVKMVPLSIVGTHSINGVAELHTDILKNRELKDFCEVFPNKFNNKTNGIVHRLWLLEANPNLSDFIEELIGNRFKKDPKVLKDLLKYERDSSIVDRLFDIKHKNKEKLAKYILDEKGIVVNPYSIFDVQIKRIHEYKRQLLNILHIMYLYNCLKDNPNLDMVPRTFIFSGKSAPSYYQAKQIIKLIHSIAEVINKDLTIKDKLKVIFLDNYGIKLATKIIPAADVSEQISTTTKEASGTSNMKFMMNGAITIATLDGANVEITKEVGENNIVLFGLKDYEIYELYRSGEYRAFDMYNEYPEIKRVVDQLISGDYNIFGEGFPSLHDRLLKNNDEFFVLKDFNSYKEAQERIGNIYRNKKQWGKMSFANIACSGAFSSDYTIKKYARDIWNIKSIAD